MKLDGGANRVDKPSTSFQQLTRTSPKHCAKEDVYNFQLWSNWSQVTIFGHDTTPLWEIMEWLCQMKQRAGTVGMMRNLLTTYLLFVLNFRRCEGIFLKAMSWRFLSECQRWNSFNFSKGQIWSILRSISPFIKFLLLLCNVFTCVNVILLLSNSIVM